MPIPPAQDPVSSRIFTEFTVGTQGKIPDKPGSVAIGTTNINNPPAFMQLLGGTMKFSPAQPVSALTSGSLLTLTVQIGVGEFAPTAVGSGRELRVLMAAGAYHSITGLVLASVQPVAIVTTTAGGTLQGAVFSGGATYQSLTLKIVLQLYAAAATAAGSVIVWASTNFYDAPIST